MYRPSLKEAWQPLSIAVIRQECQKWFDTACHWVSSEFARLLDCVTQIKTLANFRDTAYLTIQVIVIIAFYFSSTLLFIIITIAYLESHLC